MSDEIAANIWRNSEELGVVSYRRCKLYVAFRYWVKFEKKLATEVIGVGRKTADYYRQGGTIVKINNAHHVTCLTSSNN